jgi:hypothetical protein
MAGTVKKTYNLPPGLIARAKRILGARTETEAIVRSLEAITKDDYITEAAKKTGGRLPHFKPIR